MDTMSTNENAGRIARLYLVKTVDGRRWYAAGNVTQEAEQAVQEITGKNTVASCTPVEDNAIEV